MFRKKASSAAQKSFRLKPEEIVELAPGHGACLATDRITVDGELVGYAYREPPDRPEDSGWRFMAGDESDDYMSNPENMSVYDVNTIANYDPEIVPFLEASAPIELGRPASGQPLRRI